VNGNLISQEAFEDTLADRALGYEEISCRAVSAGVFGGTLKTSINSVGRVLARLTNITLNGSPLSGEAFFLQEGGRTLGYRNLFGLALLQLSVCLSPSHIHIFQWWFHEDVCGGRILRC
jgi:hypothetical protein